MKKLSLLVILANLIYSTSFADIIDIGNNTSDRVFVRIPFNPTGTTCMPSIWMTVCIEPWSKASFDVPGQIPFSIRIWHAGLDCLPIDWSADSWQHNTLLPLPPACAPFSFSSPYIVTWGSGPLPAYWVATIN